LLPSGCQRKAANQIESTPDQKSATATETPVPDEGVSETSLNVYVNGTKVNFISDSVDRARSLLGSDQQDGRYGPGEGGRIFNVLSVDGIRFIYDSKTGQFWDIIIKSDVYPVEGGGKVGDSRADVVSKYKAGFYLVVKGETRKDSYLYLRMRPDGSEGVGFRFFFDDKDTVETIAMSWWAFVP